MIPKTLCGWAAGYLAGSVEIAPHPVGRANDRLQHGATMENVLLRGCYQGIHRVGGVRAGVVEVDWAYNPMLPVPGQVYPATEIRAVTEYS